MGISICCNVESALFETADYISLVSILVNVGLTYWIIDSLQDRKNNKRILKDHYINEVKEIKSDFKTLFTELFGAKITPKNFLTWYKLANVKMKDLVEDLNEIYKIESNCLNPYQTELRNIITENKDYISQFKKDELKLSPTTKNILIRFQQNNNKIFNKIIIKINNT